ncbi:UbiH/UbiF/VisC/COQ6 family ubiquinone biosynthesis hydroxylase [Elioraea tepidiphila]|jgi:2-octaprenyl-6-methoxyphenol hydroxylase|uniref:UbiH/UbiF/VisC/COQ6 family ubiquinone biosynthesis hydroxylase n=1 Tax=Elioraea tepidiphila TaxID=457934 RepID=UPI00036F66F5|nr:UbiH/UbiF/VisC/COQ6 family ubiquinone biosynthesis hydroxylase [Elioraea tepidiphila]
MAAERDVAVTILGAGPVGATLACLLAEAGVPAAVVDRAPLPPMELPAFDGRAYAIARTSRDVLADAGVWARLGALPCPIRRIHVTDGRLGQKPSRLDLTFDTTDVGVDAFGWMVEARHLRIALNAQLPSLPGLWVAAPAHVTAVEREAERATVRLADGTIIRSRLVVAAEGRESATREAAGIAVTRWDYGQDAIVAAVRHEQPHGHVAVEHFLPAGPFAILPLPGEDDDGRTSAIVWTERRAEAARIWSLDPSGFARELARRFGDRFGAVTPVGMRWRYPLGALLAHRYTATRLALVGDAAHGIHPIAGQGLNLGFRDVGELGARIASAFHAGRDVGGAEVLAGYQRARRPANLMMLAATDALDRLFSTDVAPVRLLRDLGIAAVDRLPPLKRVFMRTAMGLSPLGALKVA